MKLGKQKQRVYKELTQLKADLIRGDYNTITEMTGLTKTDVSRVFANQLSNSDKPIKVLHAVRKLIAKREKLIA